MTILRFRCFSLWMLAFVAVFSLGCGREKTPPEATNDSTARASADEYHEVEITADDVERPADYDDAVRRIQSYRDTIRDAVAAGRMNDAHRALDEAEFVLQWLPEIARDSNVPRRHWQTVNENSQQIRDLLNKVHDNIDEDRDPDFDSVAEPIDRAIRTLNAVPASLEPQESQPDDE